MRSAWSRMSAPSPCSPGAPSSRKRSSARACATRSRGSVSSAVWKMQHVAQRLPQPPAGQRVVADVGHAARRSAPGGTPRAGDRAPPPAPTSTRRARSRSRSARRRRELLDRRRLSVTFPVRARRRAAGRARSLSARRRLRRSSRRAARPPSARGCPRRRTELEHAAALGRRGRRPKSVASVARRSGCVWASGCPGYGTASYGDRVAWPGSAQNALLVLRSQPTRIGATLPLAVCSR